MRSRIAPTMAAAVAWVLAGCGPGASSIPPGTFESVISGTRSELDGAWTLVLEPGGRYRLARGGQAAVTGRYESDGARVTFTDESGPMMCAAGLTRGTYAWRLEESQLTLEALADGCPGRRGILHARAHALRSQGTRE